MGSTVPCHAGIESIFISRIRCTILHNETLSFINGPFSEKLSPHLSLWIRLACPERHAQTAGCGFAYLAYALAVVFTTEHVPPGWTSLAILILILGGIQLLLMGVVGEYIGRIFEEVKQRPHFLSNQTAGWLNHET